MSGPIQSDAIIIPTTPAPNAVNNHLISSTTTREEKQDTKEAFSIMQPKSLLWD